jgi:hypothetical protein
MPFQRPKPARVLNKEERGALLHSYFNHYREAAKGDVKALNQTIPRGAFEDVLKRIGCILLDHAKAAANDTLGPIRTLLKENPKN